MSPADEDSAARLNMPVLPGDVLVTGTGSRVEAILSDGNVVRLDGRSELRFEQLNRTYEGDDDRTVLALARGTVAVEVREVSTRDRALRLDTDDATVLSPARSLFRVDAGRRGTEVYVLAGQVDVNGRGGRALVRAGEYAYVSGDSEVEVEAAGAPRDRFASFLEERRDRADRRDVTRYVGSDTRTIRTPPTSTTTGRGCTSRPSAPDCWRPNVPPDWTPYSLGTWRWTPAGLTWVSYESWGWLPYHYGTWAWDPVLGWYWIPGDLYAPAWVYWAYGRRLDRLVPGRLVRRLLPVVLPLDSPDARERARRAVSPEPARAGRGHADRPPRLELRSDLAHRLAPRRARRDARRPRVLPPRADRRRDGRAAAHRPRRGPGDLDPRRDPPGDALLRRWRAAP